MIDVTDFTIPGTGVLRNKLGITVPAVLSRAATDSTTLRLAELHAAPVRGGFDSTHLQAIHHHIYQDLYDWAGELRPIDTGDVPASQVEKSLNSVLDRLRRENHLKGLSAEEWARSASAYIYELGTIQPFLAGNEIALQEFAVELARKNNLDLQWDATPDIASESIALLSQAEQSANLRRLIMLAMDSRIERKKGPEVWVYRWRDIDAAGKPKMRALVVGPVTQYSTETAAWKAVSTLRLDINYHSFRPEGQPETFEQLAEHYQKLELDLEKESERKVRQTKQTYNVYLKSRIVPRWGGQPFREIKAVAVERWLGSIDDLSNGSKAKVKYVMSEVFQHAIRYGWLNDGENPMFAVRQSTKRTRVTEPLEAAEFRALILELPQKMRLIGIVAATTGLRISEVLGLKWKDIDWKTLQMEVTRSVVDGVIGKCKTETSRRPVPIDELTAEELLAWKQETAYAEPEDWVFASDKVQGRMPPWADTLLDRFLQPAAKRAGIMKWVGFHTFRHTYSTLLKANGEDVKVVQELMRHANITTTMNIYTKALTPAKREAQSRVVDVLLDRSRNAKENAA